jgi:hypothetical protein
VVRDRERRHARTRERAIEGLHVELISEPVANATSGMITTRAA